MSTNTIWLHRVLRARPDRIIRTLMKISLLAILLSGTGFSIATAVYFEREGSPGEGVPGFSAKHNELRLNKLPSKASEQITFPLRIGETITIDRLPLSAGKKFSFDKSKVITIKSVTLTAKAIVTDTFCQDMPGAFAAKKPVIQPGEAIEYLQYGAEGYVVARYKGLVCNIFVMDNIPKFDGLDKQPEVEWWIRLIDEKKTPLGWLLINEEQVKYLKRTF